MVKMKTVFAFNFIHCDCTLRQSIYFLYKTPFTLKTNLKLILNMILHSVEADNQLRQESSVKMWTMHLKILLIFIVITSNGILATEGIGNGRFTSYRCPATYSYFNNRCYRFYRFNRSYDNARKVCDIANAYLATISNAEIQRFIEDNFNGFVENSIFCFHGSHNLQPARFNLFKD